MLNSLLEDMGGGIPIGRQPHVSIDGRQFNAVFAGEKRSIAEWDNEKGVPYMEFVVVGTSRHMFKIMYSASYDPANPSPPICWSANGQGPATDVRQPQAPMCNMCDWDKWGSAVTDNGTSVKRCTDKKRLVVVSTKLGPNTPLQFDLPPASFKAWAGLLKVLRDGRIANPENIVIRCYFETNENGVLSYHLSKYVDQSYGPETLAAVRHIAGTPEVFQLTGRGEAPIDPAKWLPHMAGTPQQSVTAPATMNMIAGPQTGMGGGQPQLQYARETTGADYVQAAQQQRDPVYTQHTAQPQHFGGGAHSMGAVNQQGGGNGGMGMGSSAGASGGVGGMGMGGGAGHVGSGGGGMGAVLAGGQAMQPSGGMGGFSAQTQAALPAPETEKPKRTRRTREQIEADEKAKQAAAQPASGPIHDRQMHNSPMGAGGSAMGGNVMANHGMAAGADATSALRGQLNSALGIEIPE